MGEIDRRRFLQLTGGTAAFTALSGSIARAAAIPARRSTGSIRDVEHIVVLMQENRSFDHYFGSLRGVRGFGDPRPVTLPSGKSVWHQSDGKRDILPFRPKADHLGMQFLQDLNHDWAGGQRAFDKGRYDQWVPAKTATTMAYLTREDIPFHYALADAFTLCDAYHCSFIGSTDPNRYYLWSGYTGNDGKGGGPVLGNDEAGYGWTTYPERLEKAGISWKVYQDVGDGLDAKGKWGWTGDAYRGNYGDNSLLYFNAYRDAKPGDPLYEKARTGTDVRKGDGLFDVLKADVKAGRLPQVSWIAAPEAYSEHPNWPANYGAWYIAQVLDALTADPEVWSRTALFITYDENDGFFDHVVPPFPPASAAQGLSTVDPGPDLYKGSIGKTAGPYGLGQRVPMLVVSPWSTGGFVCSEVFDHTSVIRFMESRFGVREPNISPWRRAVCGDLTSAFDFSRASTGPAALPATDGYRPPDRLRHPDYVPKPPATGSLPRQEPGSRPTRPLPYAPFTDGTGTPATGRYTLTFGGGEAAGAQFLVTSPNRTDGPWTYTTEAGKTIADTWNTAYSKGVYDLTVHGPNGFLRSFRGPGGTAGPEVTARHNAATGDLDLVLTQRGTADCHLTVTDAYGGPAETLTVRPGATVRHTVRTRAGKRWYDVTVVSHEEGTYLRRFAGHVETGASGVSDPAIATR
ncbi:phospholipase C, phosphocholine-specific [Streptomyces mobaraensis NBRC 13819 = DSM 40847]|uniref:phospholipase C n=1 Tax=Streptomyces mobaraensis (strain ATCC 29032 / DSM 40847 / JCM 4168 / NBRC 13819 / NCIMB 11159 / IPCR 16-22) TaxID=1223523 RepID=M3C4W1_STRM1|nr:phospholipase C, phosphocholine-specific [Streptomyces mobaraensis]EME99000.1 non-hemolytic phospholipase C [Streptomyces mobaraensis NBRC 13819 = DSM 40847]QTT77285.1 phospholipase C, phosphocholine-specific [Streptomyces mobaraensis NBRC 13819 = DSM 40847]